MNELEIKIIEFLLSASVFSENAIKKNFGITDIELSKSFKILEEYGYLESYDNFIKREQLNEGDCCKTKKESSCSSCSSSHSCSSNCCSSNLFSSHQDYSKIKVITEKAVREFA